MMPKKIAIKGTIIPTDFQEAYEWMGFEATSPGQLETFLADANGEDVELEINSPGGYVFAGMEIYNRLMMYPGKVTATVMSIAASAASLITCAAKTVRMSPVSQLMIHRAHSWTEGDKNDMYKTAEDLAKLDDSIANAYIAKTGMSRDQVLHLMDVTTWLGAKDALNMHFADEILKFKQDEQPAAAIGSAVMLTHEQVAKMMEAIRAKEAVKKQQETAALELLRQRNINLMLKGETK